MMLSSGKVHVSNVSPKIGFVLEQNCIMSHRNVNGHEFVNLRPMMFLVIQFSLILNHTLPRETSETMNHYYAIY